MLILVHFLKENCLESLPRAGNPYPGAFYEGELPGKAFHELLILVHFMKENYLEAFQELEILILVHFMKEHHLAKPFKSWKSLSWCIL